MNKESILIERKNKLILDESIKRARKLSKNYLGAAIKNIQNLGYAFSKEAFDILSHYSKKDFEEYYNGLIEILKELRGAHKTYVPMYPNFPVQVMEMDEAELFINAMLHYFGDWIGVRIIPDYKKDERAQLIGNYKLTVLGLGSEKEFNDAMKNLMSSKTSISETDYKHLEYYLSLEDIELSEKIFHKEILSFVAGICFNKNKFDLLKNMFKTATDILRLITALSDGDISLATNTIYRNFKRSERRLFLEMLENCKNLKEDMYKYKDKWIRIGEILHPGEYKKYAKTKDAFKALRDSEKIKTFLSKVENSIEIHDLEKVLSLLGSRPGYFARSLDRVLRTFNTERERDKICLAFKQIAKDIANPILFQLATHFLNRSDFDKLNIVFPKGKISKAWAYDRNLDEIDQRTCLNIHSICNCALEEKYSYLEPLKKIYLDDKLKNYPIPFSQRSASRALRTVSRGSRMDISSKNFYRFFLWWKQPIGLRVDIDLSIDFLDKDFKSLEHISYTNLKSTRFNACHSGDLTSAPKGAAEFVDIDLDRSEKNGVKYVIMHVFCFTETPFYQLDECFAGWMARKDVNSGEIFHPKTVENKFDLTSDLTTAIPMILDVESKNIIWMDLGIVNYHNMLNNLECNRNRIGLLIEAFTKMKKPSLYDLFLVHANGRSGQIVDKKEDADIIFSVDEGITPYDIDTIIGEWL